MYKEEEEDEEEERRRRVRSGHNADGHWNGTVASYGYLFPSSILQRAYVRTHVGTRVHSAAALLSLLVCERFYAGASNGRPARVQKLLLSAGGRARTIPPREKQRGKQRQRMTSLLASLMLPGPATASERRPGRNGEALW